MRRKLLYILLAMVLVASLLPATAMAATATDTPSVWVGNVTLDHDIYYDQYGNFTTISGSNAKAAIKVEQGTTLNLDLNGYDIIAMDGSGITTVILNEGTLNITDSNSNNRVRYGEWNADKTKYIVTDNEPDSEGYDIIYGGMITGAVESMGTPVAGGICNYSCGILNINGGNIVGNSAIAGGGVCNHGTMVMTGGGIIGNTGMLGGGIYTSKDVATTPSTTINGGSINNNNASSNGGGIYVEQGLTVTLGGNPVITGNTVSGEANNIYLASSVSKVSKVYIDASNKLTNTMPIGISMASIGEFRAYDINDMSTDYTAKFTSDDDNYYVNSPFLMSLSLTAKPDVSGTVSITGKLNLGETLTASVSGSSQASNTFTYEWKTGDTVVGTGSTYTIPSTSSNISKTVTVTATSSVAKGNLTATSGAFIKGLVSRTPTLTTTAVYDPTTKLYTITAKGTTEMSSDTIEYSFDGVTYSSTNTTTTAKDEETVTCYARIKETYLTLAGTAVNEDITTGKYAAAFVEYNTALSKVPSDEDLTKYTDATVKALEDALSAYDSTKTYTEDEILTIADNIEKAISNLEEIVEKEFESEGNAEITVDKEIEDQLLSELFTDEEVALNEEMKVTVKVDIIPVENMDEKAQEGFVSYLEEYNASLEENTKATQAVVFDISVIRTLAGVDSTITSLKTPIIITIAIPEEYQSDDREFFILRNHNGEITILEDLDTDPTTITIETDQFSNYTLNYVEKADEVITGDEKTETTISITKTDTADTGDTSYPQILIVSMFVSLLGILVICKKTLAK